MPRSSAPALLLHRQVIGIAKSESEVELPTTAQRMGSTGRRLEHYKVAIADRRAGPACGAKDPRRRRGERELRGYESEGTKVRDCLAVDRAEEGTHDDVVGEEVGAIALLCCRVRASAIWELWRFEAGAFYVWQCDKHGRVGRNGAATLDQGGRRRQRQEPDRAGLAVVGAIAVKAGFDERMPFDGQCERPLPPFHAPLGVGFLERLGSRRIDERVGGKLRQGGRSQHEHQHCSEGRGYERSVAKQ